MTHDEFNRNSRIVSAILDYAPRYCTYCDANVTPLSTRCPKCGNRTWETADPFTRPDLPPPFDRHHCPVCQDGKLPCKTKVVGNCGNLFARND